MPDVKVNLNDRGTGSLDYVVPSTAEFLLKQAFASYDGSGAASAWLPALQLIGPDGQVAGSYVTGSTVAAGGSADVTFGPFLRGAAASTPTPPSSGGLPNAVMKKTNTQTVLGNHITQVTLDSTTFATTDGTIFTASGSNVVIHSKGLYAAFCHFVDDNAATDPTTTQFYPKWLGAVTNPNAPWQLAVPRQFNNNGPSGLQGSSPVGAGLVDMMANWSFAYVSETNATVGAWIATETASSITTSTCIVMVTQLQPITDLSSFPSYPF